MIIFTECFNCAAVAKISLDTFFKHHPDRQVHVFSSKEDFNALQEFIDAGKIVPIEYNDMDLRFQNGHEATAYIFATACTKWKGEKLIHFDSDVFFKEECVSIIENSFNEGYAAVGSRRCYKNNPVNIPVPDNCPDTLSTYFLGIDTAKIPTYDFLTLCRMWQGAYCTWNMPILDFGDPVIRAIIFNGGKVEYLNQNLVGGQDEYGKKFGTSTCFQSNLHIDMGTALCHIGGTGSGCAVYSEKFSSPKSYSDWALIRFALFCKLFLGKDILPDGEPPKFDACGRWISGSFSEEIVEQIKRDLK